MPIFLETLSQKFQRRLATLDSAFDRNIPSKTPRHRVDRFALQEGYISALWQSWCQHCRIVAISSTRGAITRSGTVTTSLYSVCTEMEIAYVAKQASQKRKFNIVQPLAGSHLEMTWGDPGRLILSVSALGPSNKNEILSGISACNQLNDLQTCRNASAHISHDLVGKVRASKVRYVGTSFEHPSDMMVWTDPASKDFLWKSWLSQMRLASDLMSG
jgi:hypothetical protein